jgi:hypothetical protein
MRRIVLTAAIAVCAAAVPLHVRADTTGWIGGRISGWDTHRPLGGATVLLSSPVGDASTRTDDGGNYVILNLAPSAYRFVVIRDGYVPMQGTIVISAGVGVRVGATLCGCSGSGNFMASGIRLHMPPALFTPDRTLDAYEITPASNPLFDAATTVGQLLPLVPGAIPGAGAPTASRPLRSR